KMTARVLPRPHSDWLSLRPVRAVLANGRKVLAKSGLLNRLCNRARRTVSGLRSIGNSSRRVFSAGRMVGSANEQPAVRETETVSAQPSFAGGLCRAAPDHRSFGLSAGRLVLWSYCGRFVARQSAGAVRSARGGLVSPARDDDAYPPRESDHVFRLSVGINNPLSGCRTRFHRLSSVVQFACVRGHDDRRELAQCSAQASFPSSPPRAGKSACHIDGLRISEWPYHGRNRAFRLARVIPRENREHCRCSVRLFHRGGARYPADRFNASLSWRTFS